MAGPAEQNVPEVCEVQLWFEGDWRCEYWTVAHHGRLRLYRGDEMIQELAVDPAQHPAALAREWRTTILRGGLPTHEPPF